MLGLGIGFRVRVRVRPAAAKTRVMRTPLEAKAVATPMIQPLLTCRFMRHACRTD